MSDQQWLKLAAKAVGLPPPVDANGVWSAWIGSPESGHWWDPLTDDGDSLRLAMQLDMTVNCNRDELTVIVQTWRPKLLKVVRSNTCDADIRRAIVEVAAMNGRLIK